jgi:L-2-hydroxyglutarate oxidase LhgO
MERFEIECAVIGAGVVGLAIARRLAMSGREVILLEKNAGIGEGISSRNSEVIHAGIYYPQNSLKARLCVQGKEMLYDYCREHAIPFSQQGKLIVAQTAEEYEKLLNIQRHAYANGVKDVAYLARNELQGFEPALDCEAALYSPSTGIIDSHALMLQFQADFERAGGQCVFNSEMTPLGFDAAGIQLCSNAGGYELAARYCINASGLDAVAFCRQLRGFPAEACPDAWFAKGSYFSYQGAVPFRHLIYPVPVHGGLGIHLTLDLQGRARFGPDVEWLEECASPDFMVQSAKRSEFASSIRRYWPALDETKLCPDYAGIRPKISGPHQTAADFLIQGEQAHGVTGLINLLGIESPGLTASLAIADHVYALMR